MPVIKCRECGGRISPSAAFCQQCGASARVAAHGAAGRAASEDTSKLLLLMIVAALVIAAVAGGVQIYQSGRGEPAQSTE